MGILSGTYGAGWSRHIFVVPRRAAIAICRMEWVRVGYANFTHTWGRLGQALLLPMEQLEIRAWINM